MSFISVFDLFKVGVGPSSSHTVGPMRAAGAFRAALATSGVLAHTQRIRVRLFGSLAHTGHGHHTDRAVLWGLAGLAPDTFESTRGERVLEEVWQQGRLSIAGRRHSLRFDPARDLVFDRQRDVGRHPNEVAFEAFGEAGELLAATTYYSVGGGFIATAEELADAPAGSGPDPIPHPFSSAAELLERADGEGLTIADVIAANEHALRAPDEVQRGVDTLWEVMRACIHRGLQAEGVLPGGLEVRRRAAGLHRKLTSGDFTMKGRPALHATDWVHCWAMAVNEENAAGGRVVTAPTNGAAGIVPAVLNYYHEFVRPPELDVRLANQTFFLTASAIGALFKTNASISGAEVGCQGEVGTASSMAAGGLTALLGGTNAQIEHAAEIAIEHNLGLTCDPVGGLVQVPCIERNGFGASKAISAARLAMHEDGDHRVSLDHAIETMRRTGLDMSSKYKETSLGGLAVRYVEC